MDLIAYQDELRAKAIDDQQRAQRNAQIIADNDRINRERVMQENYLMRNSQPQGFQSVPVNGMMPNPDYRNTINQNQLVMQADDAAGVTGPSQGMAPLPPPQTYGPTGQTMQVPIPQNLPQPQNYPEFQARQTLLVQQAKMEEARYKPQVDMVKGLAEKLLGGEHKDIPAFNSMVKQVSPDVLHRAFGVYSLELPVSGTGGGKVTRPITQPEIDKWTGAKPELFSGITPGVHKMTIGADGVPVEIEPVEPKEEKEIPLDYRQVRFYKSKNIQAGMPDLEAENEAIKTVKQQQFDRELKLAKAKQDLKPEGSGTDDKEFRQWTSKLDGLKKKKATIEGGYDPITGQVIPQTQVQTALATVNSAIADTEEYISAEYPGQWGKYRKPAPSPSAPSAKSAPMYATNPNTKQKIVSYDGGKSWRPR